MRDWDLIRFILIEAEEKQPFDASRFVTFNSNIVAYHLKLLIEAGFLSGKCVTGLTGNATCVDIDLIRSFDNLNFIDCIRSQTIWDKIKDMVKEKDVPLSLDTIKLASQKVIENHFKG